MMPHRYSGPLAGVAIALAVAAMPSVAKANATWTIGGQVVTMALDPGAYSSGTTPVITTASGGSLTNVSIFSDPDPLLTVSSNWTDGAGAGTLIQGAIYAPTAGLVDGETYDVYGSLGITITNGTNPPSSVGVGIPGGSIMRTFLCNVGETTCVTGGIELANATVTNTVAGIGQTHTFTFDYTTTIVADSAWDQEMGIYIDYLTSGDFAAYGISASYVITPVPEPMSIALLGGAVFGMIAFRRSRQFS